MSKLTRILCTLLTIVLVMGTMLISCTDKDEMGENNDVNAEINNDTENNNGEIDLNQDPANVVFDDKGNEVELGDNDAQWKW